MVRGPEDLLAHAAAASPAWRCPPRRVDRCCPGSLGEHTLGRRPCDPTKRPIPFDKYLEQINREERELALRLAHCPHACASNKTQPAPRAGEHPHQDCSRPQAARIGDIPPPPAAATATTPARTTYQVLPAVRPGRVIDVLV